jgi:hypothetical protein
MDSGYTALGGGLHHGYVAQDCDSIGVAEHLANEVLFLKKYTLKRKVIHGGKSGTHGDQMPDAVLVAPTDAVSDVEKGMPNEVSATTNDVLESLAGVNRDGEY